MRNAAPFWALIVAYLLTFAAGVTNAETVLVTDSKNGIIDRVAPGGATSVFASGFTNLIDIRATPDGSVWVLTGKGGARCSWSFGRHFEDYALGTNRSRVDRIGRRFDSRRQPRRSIRQRHQPDFRFSSHDDLERRSRNHQGCPRWHRNADFENHQRDNTVVDRLGLTRHPLCSHHDNKIYTVSPSVHTIYLRLPHQIGRP